MRRKIIIYTAVILAMTVMLAAFGVSVIHRAQAEEIKRVQNIAGAVISQYPQMESAFAEAAADEGRAHEAAGAEIMSHYGYDEEMELTERYRGYMYIYIGMAALFFCISAGMVYAVLLHTEKKRSRQQEQLLSILDDCLSGDYSLINDEGRLEDLENHRFADSLVKLAENLRLKSERLEDEQNSTKALVTDISHQLKTPISAMKVCFDMYVEAESREEKEEFLSRSRIQMDNLEKLAEALINISRMESNMISPEPQETGLTDILIGAVNIVYHKAAAKNIDIEVGEFEDMKLYMDRKWTAEAVANIIDNGIKYSPEGSRISISVQKLFSFIRVEIEDEGIGIPRDERNRIFARFFRGSRSLIREQEGSGVGLYLSRKILEDQGGTISVRESSGGGSGSIFVVQMPLPL